MKDTDSPEKPAEADAAPSSDHILRQDGDDLSKPPRFVIDFMDPAQNGDVKANRHWLHQRAPEKPRATSTPDRGAKS